MNNNKAQSQSTIGSLLVALIVVSGVSLLALSYIGGVGANYGQDLNESKYAIFEQSQEITNITSQMTDQFVNEEGTQNEDTDIISVMITGAYGTIKLFFELPQLWNNFIQAAMVSIGIPSGVAGVLSWMALSVIVVMILFAAYEAVMKVRA